MKKVITVLAVFLFLISVPMLAGAWEWNYNNSYTYSDSVDLVQGPTDTTTPIVDINVPTTTTTTTTPVDIHTGDRGGTTRTFYRTRTRTITNPTSFGISNGGIQFKWSGEDQSSTQFPPASP